jgi:hypothetical protein
MERVYCVLGGVAWTLSLVFGFSMTTATVTQDVSAASASLPGRTVTGVIPHPTSGSLAGGFAIAGGLCFVAAALSAGRRSEVPFEQIQKQATEVQDRQAGNFFEKLGGPNQQSV